MRFLTTMSTCTPSDNGSLSSSLWSAAGLMLVSLFAQEPRWRPFSQWWAQRNQQKPTINCPVSPRWLCWRQQSQRKKSVLSSKNGRFVYVCAYIFRHCCLSSSYSAFFSTEYRKSSLRNWMPPMPRRMVVWLTWSSMQFAVSWVKLCLSSSTVLVHTYFSKTLGYFRMDMVCELHLHNDDISREQFTRDLKLFLFTRPICHRRL